MKYPFSINEYVFESSGNSIYATATLYVPDGCEERYRNTDGWKRFKKIKKIENTTSIITAQRKAATPVVSYSINGHQLPALHRGLNIQCMSDGTVRNVMVK